MHLIFDFDGTLVNSLGKSLEIFNDLAEKFDFKKVSFVEVPELRNLSSRELIHLLKIPIYKIPSLLKRARKQMRNEILTLTSFLNLPQIVKKLHEANFTLGILTSNSEENVLAWLDINKMSNLFSFVHVESGYFGKASVIKKILKKYRMNKEHVFYIGDETRDIDAAKQNGIYSVAVTWGLNSEKILLQHEPHYLAKTPEDLLKACGLEEQL